MSWFAAQSASLQLTKEWVNSSEMAKPAQPKRATSFALSAELERYVNEKVASGKYRSASEVMRAALSRMAEEDHKEAALNAALDHGLASPIAPEGVFERVRARVAKRRRKR